MENEDPVGVVPVEDPAGRLDDLAVSPPSKFRRPRSAAGMIDDLINMMKGTLDQGTCRGRIL
jgi:hypothetical protein